MRRFPEQVMQVTGHRVHAAWPAPRSDMAIRADQDDRPGAAVTASGCFPGVDGDDVEVLVVGAQRSVGQHTGSVSGNEQNVAAAAQHAVQRGELAVRSDRNVGHALAGPGPAPAAIGARQGPGG